MSEPLPTVFVVHPREKRSKCTLEPLRGRPGFLFHEFPKPFPSLGTNYVRLGMSGPLLGPADAGAGLLVLDATWRLAARMEPFFAAVPVRSLPETLTAYPRTSKLVDDPMGGLATIEAVYVAYRVLGRETAGLLDGYRWAEAFLKANGFSASP